MGVLLSVVVPSLLALFCSLCSNNLSGSIPERISELGENFTTINLNFNSKCGHEESWHVAVDGY